MYNDAEFTFHDTATVTNLFEWLEGPFVDTIYGGATFTSADAADQTGVLFGTNVLVGGWCSVGAPFSLAFTLCRIHQA